MKTKEKAHRKAKSRDRETKSIFPEMKESDMTAIDRKIHDLLIAEGYRMAGTQRFEGMELNNYTNSNRIEYRRGERERVFAITNSPMEKGIEQHGNVIFYPFRQNSTGQGA
jgi:hypothetical protein